MRSHLDYFQKLVQCAKNVVITYADYDEELSYERGVEELVQAFLKVRCNGGKVFFIGNGGSAAIAIHMTADFMKNGKMKTYSLYDSSVVSCMGNDYGYEEVFSRQLEVYMDKNDLLVAISSSGNSLNIVNAIDVARKKNSKVITLSGFKPDNRIRQMGDYNVYIGIEHYGIVESIHNLLLQQIVDTILDRGDA